MLSISHSYLTVFNQTLSIYTGKQRAKHRLVGGNWCGDGGGVVAVKWGNGGGGGLTVLPLVSSPKFKIMVTSQRFGVMTFRSLPETKAT